MQSKNQEQLKIVQKELQEFRDMSRTKIDKMREEYVNESQRMKRDLFNKKLELAKMQADLEDERHFHESSLKIQIIEQQSHDSNEANEKRSELQQSQDVNAHIHDMKRTISHLENFIDELERVATPRNQNKIQSNEQEKWVDVIEERNETLEKLKKYFAKFELEIREHASIYNRLMEPGYQAKIGRTSMKSRGSIRAVSSTSKMKLPPI